MILICLCFLCSTTSSAQNLFENPTIYSTLDGLPSDKITSLAEDAEGFIWIGTDNGLSRFDGSIFENFFRIDGDDNSLKNNHVLDVLADEKNHKIWVATVVGLSAYDTQKKTFKNYYHDDKNLHSIPDHRAYSLFKDEQAEIWIGFRAGGVLRYRPETDDFERYLCYDESIKNHEVICGFGVVAMADDYYDKDILWLATHYGLVELNKKTGEFNEYVHEDDDEHFRNFLNSLGDILTLPDGNLYLASYNQGVTVFNPKTKNFSFLDPCFKSGNKAFEKNIISRFYKKSTTQFWITSIEGLQLYDSESNCIVETHKNDSEHKYGINHIDQKGRHWSKTTDRGLQIFNPLELQSQNLVYEFDKDLFLSYTTKILEGPAGKLYIVADNSRGLFIHDRSNNQWKCIPPPADYPMQKLNGFRAKDMAFLPDGSILIIEDSRFYWYQPGSNTLRLYPLQTKAMKSRFRKVIKGENNDYWISSYVHGLDKLDFDQQKIISYEERLDELGFRLGGDYMAMDAKGNIWMREHNGLIVYEVEKDQFIYHPHDQVKNNSIRGMGAIVSDSTGAVWIASRSDKMGFAHADSTSAGVLKFFYPKDGLKGEQIYLVKPYRNKLLIFSDVGMQEFNPATMQFGKFYAASYGFGNDISSATILADGSLAVAAPRSIKIFSPNQLKINEEDPLPYISAFSVFDKTWKLKSTPSQKDTVELSYKQNFFSFEFSSIAYNFPEKTNFQYKLNGFDENWQDGTKRRFAAYTNVPGGDYQFMVKAVNNEGRSLTEPSITYLHISTVWYKTTWFWILATLLISSLAYIIYKWRIGQVRKEERIKSDYERKLAKVEMSALRAQMNPHFIFNSLNSIEFYIINNDPEKASDYLNRFSRLIRLILQNSKNTVVSLKDDLEALKLYIEMEAMRFDDLFDYEVKIEKGIDLEEINVPPMLLQPYVENAIWHGLMQKEGGRGKLELMLERENGHLLCFVEDNGIGREAASKLRSKSATRRKSYGMKITSDRLAMLNNLAGSNASVEVLDLKNKDGSAAGTRVELAIPLPRAFTTAALKESAHNE